jgi:hypothetical protein
MDPISTANSAVSHITGAIRQAAQSVGTSFSYLLATAKVESNLNPGAQASTSSASGLFQFIDQTWLQTMKESGPQLGLGNYANAITQNPDGRMEVADPAMRNAILGLRQDPGVNAAIAGAFTNKNAAYLKSTLGRTPTDGELYIAHFLGAGGAGKLITEASTSNAPAAQIFPDAAAANRSVFYDKSGRMRLSSEVYANLTGRYETARQGTIHMVDGASATSGVRIATAIPDPAGTTMAYAAYQPQPRVLEEPGKMFYGLFHTTERSEPVAPRINQIWNAQAASEPRPVAQAQAAPAAPANGGGFGLFQDTTSDIRGLFRGGL